MITIKKHNILLIGLSLVVLGLVTLAAFVAPRTHAEETYTNCKTLSQKLLDKNNSKYEFGKCERTDFQADSGQTLSKIDVTAGKYKTGWEFECGYMSQCANYSGWFNGEGEIVDFVSQPVTANQDPSVYSLGCGDPFVSSIYDTKVKPELVYIDNEFAWKISYDRTQVNSPRFSSEDNLVQQCSLSGTSYIYKDKVVSSTKVTYNGELQSDTRQAIEEQSVRPCATKLQLSEVSDGYSYSCLRNYIMQTNDRSYCDEQTDIGTKVNCDSLPILKRK